MIKMLNLIIGKKYKITSFDCEKEKICKILSKTIHTDTCHSYFVTYEYNKKECGCHIWDYGNANSNKEIVFSTHSIKTCEEVIEEVYMFDYEVCDLKDTSASLYKNSKLAIHTTVNGEGKVAKLNKKINKDTINIKDKWLY